MTDLVHRNDKFVTRLNKRSKITPSISVHFATRVRRLRFIRHS
jgi:hypothetical protein